MSREDLGQSVQAVRQHLNKTRSELYQSEHKGLDSREIASRQLQIDDMLLTLLQETAGRIQRLEMEVRHARRLMRDAEPTVLANETGPRIPQLLDLWTPEGPDEDPFGWPPTEIEGAMRDAALQLGPQVRPVSMPLVGGLLTRLRDAVHDLPLFYTRRLAKKQAVVNRTYGNWILHLYRLLQYQQNQIQALIGQLAALEARTTTGQASVTNTGDR
jgi:hypothetical protein